MGTEPSRGLDNACRFSWSGEAALEGSRDFNPRKWPRHRKILSTAIALTTGIAGGWASSNISAVSSQAKEEFKVSDITESLATGLYLMGFGVGSLFSGPFSELAGRNPVYLCTGVAFTSMLLGSGLAQNITNQLICRFLAGVFGCTAVTTFAGSTADMWEPSERGLILSTSSTINFAGVFLAPVIGGYIGESESVDWRWAEYIAIIIAGTSFVLIFLFLPETNAAVIDSWRARHVQKFTNNQKNPSEKENKRNSLGTKLAQSVYRPFTIISQESTVFLFTTYLAVVYLVTFTFLTGYTFIYSDTYGFSQSSTGLCFLGLSLGIVLAGVLGIPLQSKYARDLVKAQALSNRVLPPEERLLYALFTAPALPIGLFWMAWTVRASISYWSSLGGSILIGVAFEGLFVPIYLYVIDMFEDKAASALAIATVVRYVVAGAMVPASIPIYRALGVRWTLTMLACVSLVLTPLPYLFYKYGHHVRRRSRNAVREYT